jgi:hypothetical protein
MDAVERRSCDYDTAGQPIRDIGSHRLDHLASMNRWRAVGRHHCERHDRGSDRAAFLNFAPDVAEACVIEFDGP